MSSVVGTGRANEAEGLIPNTVPNLYAVSREDGSRSPVAAWGSDGEMWAVGTGVRLFEADFESFYGEVVLPAGPALPEVNGTMAYCNVPKRDGHTTTTRTPVIAWDAEGFALVVDPDLGRLVRVAVWATAWGAEDAHLATRELPPLEADE